MEFYVGDSLSGTGEPVEVFLDVASWKALRDRDSDLYDWVWMALLVELDTINK